jgi:hypothetical protein
LEETYEDDFILGESGTGLWYRWVAERPHERLAPGILQGAPIEYWSQPKSSGLLAQIVATQKGSSQDGEDETTQPPK